MRKYYLLFFAVLASFQPFAGQCTDQNDQCLVSTYQRSIMINYGKNEPLRNLYNTAIEEHKKEIERYNKENYTNEKLPSSMVLLYAGTLLDLNRPAGDYNLSKRTTLRLVASLREQPILTISSSKAAPEIPKEYKTLIEYTKLLKRQEDQISNLQEGFKKFDDEYYIKENYENALETLMVTIEPQISSLVGHHKIKSKERWDYLAYLAKFLKVPVDVIKKPDVHYLLVEYTPAVEEGEKEYISQSINYTLFKMTGEEQKRIVDKIMSYPKYLTMYEFSIAAIVEDFPSDRDPKDVLNTLTDYSPYGDDYNSWLPFGKNVVRYVIELCNKKNKMTEEDLKEGKKKMDFPARVELHRRFHADFEAEEIAYKNELRS